MLRITGFLHGKVGSHKRRTILHPSCYAFGVGDILRRGRAERGQNREETDWGGDGTGGASAADSYTPTPDAQKPIMGLVLRSSIKQARDLLS